MSTPITNTQTMSQPSSLKRKRTQYYPSHHHVNTEIINANLPDDVLENIFSFLPIKNALQNGLLSTRFKNSWHFNRKLYFGEDFARSRSREDFKSIVNNIFNLHAGQNIQCLHLFFDPTGEDSLVQSWIKTCIDKGVEELDLNFFNGKDRFKLPIDFFDIECLRVLKLNSCKVDFPPMLKGLRFLNTLVLRKVSVPSTLIDNLFCNCIFIETFELTNCETANQLIFIARNLKKFKALKIGGCLNVSRIYIDAPSLTTIYYYGDIPIFQFGDVLKLDDVMLYFRPVYTYDQSSFRVINLVYDLCHINVLTATSAFLERLTRRCIGGIWSEWQFCFWNLRELQLIMQGAIFCNISDVAAFLIRCPSLEKIVIDLYNFTFECGQYWQLHQRDDFLQCYLSFPFLKLIKVKGFKFQKHEILLVKFLLERAIHLEKLALVTPKPAKSRRLGFKADSAIYNMCFQSWKASPMAKIDVYEHSKDESFIEPTHPKFWY